MPKRRDSGRRAGPPLDSTEPPEQAEVERAIETIVERLKPKLPKPGAPTGRARPRKPDREARPIARLSLVWDRDGEGA